MSKISYIKSAVMPDDYPPHRFSEVAFMGRSNAGKSSLINALSKNKIAKVSQNPGKTRLLNFFNFNDSYVLVDMPGYGYASRSGDEVADWQPMIELYLASREKLAGLVLVMDIRRKWSRDEMLLCRFVEKFGRPVALALTKADKLNKTELKKAIQKQTEDSRLSNIFVISSTKNMGHKELEAFIYKKWINEPITEIPESADDADDTTEDAE